MKNKNIKNPYNLMLAGGISQYVRQSWRTNGDGRVSIEYSKWGNVFYYSFFFFATFPVGTRETCTFPPRHTISIILNNISLCDNVITRCAATVFIVILYTGVTFYFVRDNPHECRGKPGHFRPSPVQIHIKNIIYFFIHIESRLCR